jgi:hypothetical protein
MDDYVTRTGLEPPCFSCGTPIVHGENFGSLAVASPADGAAGAGAREKDPKVLGDLVAATLPQLWSAYYRATHDGGGTVH